ncbi:MAG: hypothetical protein IJY71_08510 [Clostridia bacterium]|nr:hypothetical protein [Clostridia bacterium]
MAKLTMEFIGFSDLEGHLTVGGGIPTLSRTKQNTYLCTIESTEKSLEVVIHKSHRYTGRLWFFWNLLFFFISILGIFDVRPNKKFPVLDGRLRIPLEEDTSLLIRRLDFADGAPLFAVENGEAEVLSNLQYYDKEARRRHKIFSRFKLIATVLLVLLLIIILAF